VNRVVLEDRILDRRDSWVYVELDPGVRFAKLKRLPSDPTSSPKAGSFAAGLRVLDLGLILILGPLSANQSWARAVHFGEVTSSPSDPT
jgi:hypothetical protein